MGRRILVAVGVAWAAWAGFPARAAQPLDLTALRDAAAPRVCLVVVEGGLGLPVARASGFLLGEGKFVVTDLAALAQPGVKGVTVQFRDGSTASAKEFGLADPVLGLAVVRLENPRKDLGGLALSSAGPVENATEALVVGWKWGQTLDYTRVVLHKAVAASTLAEGLKLHAPKAEATFMPLMNCRTEIASGSPLLDASGEVVGILLQVVGAEMPYAVPAGLLRSALVSADPRLKPLKDLPKPFWPVEVVRLAGKPATAADFGQAVRNAKFRSLCDKCRGNGTVMVSRKIGTQHMGGMVRNIYQESQETCDKCKGEGVLCGEAAYAAFSRMAEVGTRLLTVPDLDAKVRDAAVANSAELLNALNKVGQGYRDDFIQLVKKDLARSGAEFPRGVVVYAQVKDLVDGPDGRYAILEPCQARVTLAVKLDRLTASRSPEAKSAAPKLNRDEWIILGGLAEGPVALEGHRPIHVVPFGWTLGPTLGPPAHHGSSGEATPPPPVEPRPPKKNGAPGFFGL